jgi:hypothetical protein
MVFIFILIINIFTNFALTIWNLIEMIEFDHYDLSYRIPFIPDEWASNHVMLKVMSFFVLMITGFFAVPVFVLL